MAVAAESKKEEFQKYLEKNGVIDAMTKVLVGLYEAPEKPDNAIDFIKEYLGAPVGVDVEALNHEIATLRKENEQLKKRVADLEGAAAAPDAAAAAVDPAEAPAEDAAAAE